MRVSIQDIIHSAVEGHNLIVKKTEEMSVDPKIKAPEFDPVADIDLAIQIIDINNLLLSDAELKQIHCRVIAHDEKTFYSIKSTKATKNKITLEQTRIAIAEAISTNDEKNLRIQIIQSTGNVARNLAVIELGYGDLHRSDGATLQVPFQLDGVENVSSIRVKSCGTVTRL